MNCGNNSQISCDIAEYNWTCDNLYQCNNQYDNNVIHISPNTTHYHITKYNITMNNNVTTHIQSYNNNNNMHAYN